MRHYIFSNDDDIVVKESRFKTVGYEQLYHHVFCYLNLPKYLANLYFSKREITLITVLLFAQLHFNLTLDTRTDKIRELLLETGLEEIILSGYVSLRKKETLGALKRTEARDLRKKAEKQKHLHEIFAELRRTNVLGEVKGFVALQHKLARSIPSLVRRLRRSHPRIVTANMAFILTSQGRPSSETPLFREETQYVRVLPGNRMAKTRRIRNIPSGVWRTECYRSGEPRFKRNRVNPVDVILLRRILPQREYFYRLNLRESEIPLVFCRDRSTSKAVPKLDFADILKPQADAAPDFALYLFSRGYISLFSRGIAAFRRTLNQITIGSLKKTRKKRSGIEKTGRRRYSVQRKSTATLICRLRAHPLFLYFSLPLARRLEISGLFKANPPDRGSGRRSKVNALPRRKGSEVKAANRMIMAARLSIDMLEKLFALRFAVNRNQILKVFLISAEKKSLLLENNGLELLYEHLKSLEIKTKDMPEIGYEPKRNNLYAVRGLTELQRIVQRGILIRLLETQALLHERNFDFPFSGVYMRKIMLTDTKGNLTAIRQVGGLSREIRRVFARLGIETPPGYQVESVPEREQKGVKREIFTALEGIMTAAGRKRRKGRFPSLPWHRRSGKCFISLYAGNCPFYSAEEERCDAVCAQHITMQGFPPAFPASAKKYPNVAEEAAEYWLPGRERSPGDQISRYLPG